MNGVELIAALRERKITVPAILITSHPSSELKKRTALAGVPIIEKPLFGSTLLDGIHQAMTQSPSSPH